MGTSLALLLL